MQGDGWTLFAWVMEPGNVHFDGEFVSFEAATTDQHHCVRPLAKSTVRAFWSVFNGYKNHLFPISLDRLSGSWCS